MSRSRDHAQGSCFSGIVSRIFCTRSLPTHPTPPPENEQIKPTSRHQSFKDLITNEDSSSKPSNEKQDEAKETIMPGVVARLMGLETMPPKDGNLGSYLRSRSVNFVDYLYSCDDLTSAKPQHRRVKTSLSFREVPAGFEKENALEKEKGSLKKSRVSNNRQAKQRKVDRSEGHARNRGNIPKKKQSRISDEPQREIAAKSSTKIEVARKRIGSERIKVGTRDVNLGSNNKLKNKKKKRLGNRRKNDERYPESTSSVSDSCPQDSSLHLKIHKSGHEEITCLKKSISKFNEFGGRLDEEVSSASRRDLDKKTRLDLHTGGYINMLSHIGKLAEDDITGSSWIGMKFEDLEEICMYLSEDILELLLNYLTEEVIVEFDSRNIHDFGVDFIKLM